VDHALADHRHVRLGREETEKAPGPSSHPSRWFVVEELDVLLDVKRS